MREATEGTSNKLGACLEGRIFQRPAKSPKVAVALSRVSFERIHSQWPAYNFLIIFK